MRKRAAGIGRANYCEERSTYFFLCLVGALWLVPYEALSEAIPPQVSQEAASGVAATVNGAPITSQELDNAVNSMLPRATGHRQLSETRTEEIKKEVLEDLIQKELLYQEAKRENIQVSSEEIEAEMEKIQNRFFSEQDFKAAIKKNGLTEEKVRSGIERFLAVRKVSAMGIDSKVTIQDQDLVKYYEENRQKFVQPEEREIRQILISVDPGGSDKDWEAGLKKANALFKKIKAGGDFAELAKINSDDTPTKERGGNLGFLPRNRMQVKELEETAFALEVGQVSSPVKTIYGYFILKLDGIKPSRPLAFSEVDKDALRKELRDQGLEKRRREWLEELRAKAEIKVFK
jgi:parvulin-like peptidyl-prolyl isomerase